MITGDTRAKCFANYKRPSATTLSCRMYLTANILVALVFLLIDTDISQAIQISAAVFGMSLVFSIPAGFALYYCFKLVNKFEFTIITRWVLFIILLFITASIPYLFFSGMLSGELANKELLIVFYFSEGSAFAAALLNSFAIHRHFKTASYETI
jgi:hypothetical protein